MLVSIIILILALPIFADSVVLPVTTNNLGTITNTIGVSTNRLVLSTNRVDISKYECKVCTTLKVCDRLRDMKRLAEIANDTNAVEFITNKERLILGKQKDMPEGVIITKPPVVEFKVVDIPTADIEVSYISVMYSPTADILAVRPLTADILAVRPPNMYYSVTTHDIDSWRQWYNITEFRYDDGSYGRVDKGTLLYDYLPVNRYDLSGESVDVYLNLRNIIIERRRVHNE